MAIIRTFKQISDGDQLNQGWFRSHIKNVITLTENMIQSTKLSADASVTDITRSNAQVDVFTDSNGYNDTVNTGSTTAEHGDSTDLFSCGQNAGTPETKTHNTMDGLGNDISFDITCSALGCITKLQVQTGGSESGRTITLTIDESGYGNILTKTISASSGSVYAFNLTVADYIKLMESGKTYTIELDGSSNGFMYYKDGQSYSGTNFSYSNESICGFGSSEDFITFVPGGYQDGVLITSSNTFDFNIASCLISAETTAVTGTSITVDVSTDGGSTYDVTGQSLREVLELDNDDTDLVLKFNLTTTDDSVTPTISSYAVQLFNQE